MKREFLKSLGIEDKEIIDKILDENSLDIGKAKGELDTYKSKVSTLEDEIKSKNDEIKTLNGKVGDVEKLTTKISDLETENTKLKTNLDTKVSELQKSHAIESGVRDAKAKNVKAVMALLDMEKITFENGELSGISEQLEKLKSGDDTSFLFGDSQPGTPAGTHITNPPSGGNGGNPPTAKTLSEAIAKAMNK